MSAPAATEAEIKAFAGRYRRLFDERKALAGDIRELDAEVKAQGIDQRLLKAAVKALEIAASDRDQVDAVFNAYLAAMGGPTEPQEVP